MFRLLSEYPHRLVRLQHRGCSRVPHGLHYIFNECLIDRSLGMTPVNPQQAVMLREITLAPTPTVVSMDPGSNVGMVTRKVQAPIWLSEICVELFREIGYLGDCIKEIMRNKQDPHLIAPDSVHVYELALAH